MLTFQPSELVATKIRALYQRSKGRHLFDLWLALQIAEIPPSDILGAFGPYRPKGLTAGVAIANFRAKLADRGFRADIDPLLAERSPDYDIDTAAQLVTNVLLARLEDDPHTAGTGVRVVVRRGAAEGGLRGSHSRADGQRPRRSPWGVAPTDTRPLQDHLRLS